MMCGAASAPAVVGDCGFFLLVIDPDLLSPDGEYSARVAQYANDLCNTRLVDESKPGSGSVRVVGKVGKLVEEKGGGCGKAVWLEA